VSKAITLFLKEDSYYLNPDPDHGLSVNPDPDLGFDEQKWKKFWVGKN
jgi:hypothetical protein